RRDRRAHGQRADARRRRGPPRGVPRGEGRHLHQRAGPRPEVRARLPAQAAGPRALGAPPAPGRRARLGRPQLDARGPPEADRRGGRRLRRRPRGGARGRHAAQEGRLRLGRPPMTLLDWAIVLLRVAPPAPLLPAIVPPLVWVERRVAAFIQDRPGPNRVGPFGILQSPADILKLFMKEEVVPATVDRFLFFLAPGLAVFAAL